jgi:DNA-binding PucR family transcriptional regulator
VHDLIADGVADGRLVVADEHLAELIVHGDPELAASFAERRLRPLAGLTPASREKHLETLTAWLDHQGGVRAAASALHVHPQTVRYRLERLRELFGDQLDDAEGRFELALAVRAARADGPRK